MAGGMRLVAQPDAWELRVFIGRHSFEEVKYRYVRFRGRRRQGERELVRLVIDQEDKPAPLIESELARNSSTTINYAIAAWRENGWGDLSPTTIRHYQELWDRHNRRDIPDCRLGFRKGNASCEGSFSWR